MSETLEAAAQVSGGRDDPNHADADLRGFPVILINGPPRAGKDVAASAIVARVVGARVLRFAAPLKASTHAAFGLNEDPDYYECVKDEPLEAFGGLTPRQAYIAMSENGIKAAFGPTHFGNVLVSRLRRRHRNAAGRALQMAVIPDSGFSYEAHRLVRAVGPDSVLLIRVHREGCDFAGDSRSYIDLEGVRTVDVTNNGTEEAWQREAVHLARAFIAGRVAEGAA